MAGVCKLVAVLSGGQWLVRVSWLLFCQETSGRPMAGMCKLVAVLSGGQWLACVMFCQEASGWVCELLLFCQETSGWQSVSCCFSVRPMAGVCKLVAVL